MSCVHIIGCNFLRSGHLIHNTDWCLFFRRLKINHDSHEFILESGTVANMCTPSISFNLPRSNMVEYAFVKSCGVDS
jgi:hypothetical protein